LFVPCGRLSWLPVSFLLHVKHTLYRIGSYRIVSTVLVVVNIVVSAIPVVIGVVVSVVLLVAGVVFSVAPEVVAVVVSAVVDVSVVDVEYAAIKTVRVYIVHAARDCSQFI